MSQFVKERRTQHEGKQTYYQIDIYLVVEQQKVGCTEKEPGIQGYRYKKYRQHIPAVEQEAERIRKLVDCRRTEQFLFIEERAFLLLGCKQGCDELIDNHPHLFGRVFACLLFSVGSNGFFFRLVELQFFYQFHNGLVRFVILSLI